MLARRLLVLAALAACGPGEAPAIDALGPRPEGGPGPIADDGAQSGSRLKINWIELEGTRTWSGFHDAQLGIDCHIREWADGELYCAPDGGGSISYSDAGCTAQVGRVYHAPDCTVEAPAYFTQYLDGCAYRPSRLYPKQTKIAVANWYSKGSDGTCYGPFTPTSYDFYSLGPEVDHATTLAPVRLGAPFGTTRLGQRDYSSADGMYLPGTVHDAAAGLDCYPTYRYAESPTGTCVPMNAGYINYFRDATCTQPAVTADQGCVAPEFAVHYDDYCPTTEGRYYAVGAELGTTSVYYDAFGTCDPTTVGTDKVFATGRELELATITRARDNANGRYALIHYTTDGVHLRDSVLYDQDKQTECYLYDLPDGSVRCLPNAHSIDTWFTDAACGQPIALMEVFLGDTGCTPPPLTGYGIRYIPPQPNQCGYSYQVHAAQAQYTGTLYSLFGGTCAPYTTTNSALYRIGPAIPLTDFPAATLSHD